MDEDEGDPLMFHDDADISTADKSGEMHVVSPYRHYVLILTV